MKLFSCAPGSARLNIISNKNALLTFVLAFATFFSFYINNFTLTDTAYAADSVDAMKMREAIEKAVVSDHHSIFVINPDTGTLATAPFNFKGGHDALASQVGKKSKSDIVAGIIVSEGGKVTVAITVPPEKEPHKSKWSKLESLEKYLQDLSTIDSGLGTSLQDTSIQVQKKSKSFGSSGSGEGSVKKASPLQEGIIKSLQDSGEITAEEAKRALKNLKDGKPLDDKIQTKVDDIRSEILQIYKESPITDSDGNPDWNELLKKWKQTKGAEGEKSGGKGKIYEALKNLNEKQKVTDQDVKDLCELIKKETGDENVLDQLKKLKRENTADESGKKSWTKNIGNAENEVMNTLKEGLKRITRETVHGRAQKNSLGGVLSVAHSGKWGIKPKEQLTFDTDFDISFFADVLLDTDPHSGIIVEIKTRISEVFSAQPENLGIVITGFGYEANADVYISTGGKKWAIRESMSEIYFIDPVTGELSKNFSQQPERLFTVLQEKILWRTHPELFTERGRLKPGITAEEVKRILKADPNIPDAYKVFIDGHKFTKQDAATAAIDMSCHVTETIEATTPEEALAKIAKQVARSSDVFDEGMKGVEWKKHLTPEDMKLMEQCQRLDNAKINEAKVHTELILKLGDIGDPADWTPEQANALDSLIDKVKSARKETKSAFDSIGGSKTDLKQSELRQKAVEVLRKQSQVAHYYIVEEILKLPHAERARAMAEYSKELRKLQDHYGKKKDVPVESIEWAAKAEISIKTLFEIDSLDTKKTPKIIDSAEKIRKAHDEQIKRVDKLLQESETGKKLQEKTMKIAETVSKPTLLGDEPGFFHPLSDFVAEFIKQHDLRDARAITAWAGSLAMAASMIETAMNAKDDIDLAIGVGHSLIQFWPPFMIAENLGLAVIEGDNEKLAKAIAMILLPETALPDMVHAIGNVAINIAAALSFDTQLDALYYVSVFKDGKLVKTDDYNGTVLKKKLPGAEDFKAKKLISPIDVEEQFERSEGFEALFYWAFVEQGGERLLQEMINKAVQNSKTILADEAKGINFFMKATVRNTVRSTVINGNQLIFKEDGPLQAACANIRKYDQQIKDFTTVFKIKLDANAKPADFGDDMNNPQAPSWATDLDQGQVRALSQLIWNREKWRIIAKESFLEAIIRTLEIRERAESDVKAKKRDELYKKLTDTFNELDIYDSGVASFEAASGYNMAKQIWVKSFNTQHERDVQEMKVLQAFNDAYSSVKQTRESIENAFSANTSKSPAPRPLTSSLPLTADPEKDLNLAREFAQEMAGAGQKIEATLVGIKKSPLDTDGYDRQMYSRIYEAHYLETFFNIQKKAARHMAKSAWFWQLVKKYDAETAYLESDKKEQEYYKLYKDLIEEFRKHYAEKNITLTVSGPDKGEVGKEVKLEAVLKDKDEKATDIPKNTKLEWTVNDKMVFTGKTYSFKPDRPEVMLINISLIKEADGKGEVIAATETPHKLEIRDWKPTVTIKGQSEGEVGKEIGLFAEVLADDAMMKTLHLEWSIEGQAGIISNLLTASFTPSEARTYKVKVDAYSKVGKNEFRVAGDDHIITVRKKPDEVKPPDDETGVQTGGSETGGQTGSTETGVQTGSTGTGIIKEPPTCTYKYSDWGECNRGTKTQTRTVIAKEPVGCIEKDKPALEQGCTPPPTEEEKRNSYLNCLCSCTPFWQSPPWYGSKNCGGHGPCESRTFAYGSVLCSFIKAKPECAAGCYKNIYGKEGDPESIEKDIRETNRKFKEPLKAKLSHDKCPIHVQLGDVINFSASTEGGIPPYKFNWSGEGQAKEGSFTFANSRKPGTNIISVTVSDDDGGAATASCQVIVDAITVDIEKTSPAENVLPIGSTASFRAIVKSGANSASGELKFQWQPHPAVQFGDEKNPLFETTAPNTTATYTETGTFLMWVEVLKKMGEVYQTIGRSQQIPIEVTLPKLKLTVDKKEPYIGDTVAITVHEEPKMSDDIISFWWEIKGDAENAGPAPNIPNERMYTFKPKNTKPFTVTAHAKSKMNGDDLGEESLTITAKSYSVTIGEPRYLGPKPKIWKCDTQLGGQCPGLVDVGEQQFAVFHDIFMKATVTPSLSGARYDWSVEPKGSCGIPGSGDEIKINCSQTGSYEVTVKVRNADNAEVGAASRSVNISVSQEEIDRGSKAKDAYDKLARAKTLVSEGKLDEGISLAEEASRLDTKNTEASSLANKWKKGKQKVTEHIDKCKQSIEKNDYTGAQKELDAAKKLHPKYKPVLDTEDLLKKKKEELEEKKKIGEAQKLAQEGQALEQQGKLAEALEKYQAAQKIHADNDVAAKIKNLETRRDSGKKLKDQAAALEGQKKLKEAIEKYKESIKQWPDKALEEKIKKLEDDLKKGADVQDKINKAKALKNQGKLDEAISVAEEAAKENRTAADPILKELSQESKNQGWRAVNDRDFKTAVKRLEDAVRLNPDDKDAKERFERAKQFSRRWDDIVNKEIPEFDRMVNEKKPFSAHKQVLRIQELQHDMPGGGSSEVLIGMNKRFYKAMDEYNVFSQEASRKHTEYFKSEDWDAMLMNAQEMTQRELSPADEKEAQSRIQFAQQRLAERNQAWSYYLSVKTIFDKGDLRQASDMLRDLKTKPQYFIKTDPRRQQIGDLIAAIEKGQKVAAAKDYARTFFRLGEEALRGYNYEGASKHFTEGLKAIRDNGDIRDPDYAKYYNLYEEAVAKDKRIKELWPGVSNAAMTEQSLSLEAIEKALKEAQEMLLLQPNNTDIQIYKNRLDMKLKNMQDTKLKGEQLWNEGRNLFEQNRPSDALGKFKESLKYLQTPEHTKYVQELETKLSQNKEIAKKLRAEGEALQNQDRLEEAVAKYRESLKYLPDPKLEEHIKLIETKLAEGKNKKQTGERLWQEGRALYEQNKWSDALTKFKESLTYSPDPVHQDYVQKMEAAKATAKKFRDEGEAFQNQGKLQEAVSKYKESVKTWPNPALQEHIVKVENEIRSIEDKKACAKKNRDEGAALQQQNRLSEALEKYRASYACRPTPEMQEHIKKIESAISHVNVEGLWDFDGTDLTLKQQGEKLTGKYTEDNGELTGNISGNIFEGYWIENNSAKKCSSPQNGRYYWGKFKIEFEGDRLTGRWSYCEDKDFQTRIWHGMKKGIQQPTPPTVNLTGSWTARCKETESYTVKISQSGNTFSAVADKEKYNGTIKGNVISGKSTDQIDTISGEIISGNELRIQITGYIGSSPYTNRCTLRR